MRKTIAFQAAKLIKERYKVKQGVYIHIDKNIPVSAGLGGGSSDAAATLEAESLVEAEYCEKKNCWQLGAEIGSDVPFCVTGGTALANGRGEPRKDEVASTLLGHFGQAAVSVSTSEIYRQFDVDQSEREPKSRPSSKPRE